MSKRLKKQFKQEKAQNSENNFEKFCQKNDIQYEKIDDTKSKELKEKYLNKADGKCPDFWCKKDEKEIFVEVKTLTNLTNERREKSIEKATAEIKAKGLPGGMTSEVFNPTEEMRGPFTSFIKDASNKFKNLKEDLVESRILFLNGVFGNIRFTAHALFLGAYDSYTPEGDARLSKKERGIFDSTGSNVSAVIY